MATFKAKDGDCLAVAFDMSEKDVLEALGVEDACDRSEPDFDLVRRIYRVPASCEDVESYIINSISIKGV